MQVDTLADYSRDAHRSPRRHHFTSPPRAWVRDDTGGTASCQNNSKQADYLQITSTVTRARSAPRPSRSLESLVAPSVAVLVDARLARRAGQRPQRRRRAGLAVDIAGPAGDTATTNDTGCAVFQFIPIGNYDITLNRPGWVDHFGTPCRSATRTSPPARSTCARWTTTGPRARRPRSDLQAGLDAPPAATLLPSTAFPRVAPPTAASRGCARSVRRRPPPPATRIPDQPLPVRGRVRRLHGRLRRGQPGRSTTTTTSPASPARWTDPGRYRTP